MIPWVLFWQIVLLLLILWMIVSSLMGTYMAAKTLRGAVAEVPEVKPTTLYSGSSDT